MRRWPRCIIVCSFIQLIKTSHSFQHPLPDTERELDGWGRWGRVDGGGGGRKSVWYILWRGGSHCIDLYVEKKETVKVSSPYKADVTPGFHDVSLRKLFKHAVQGVKSLACIPDWTYWKCIVRFAKIIISLIPMPWRVVDLYALLCFFAAICQR